MAVPAASPGDRSGSSGPRLCTPGPHSSLPAPNSSAHSQWFRKCTNTSSRAPWGSLPDTDGSYFVVLSSSSRCCSGKPNKAFPPPFRGYGGQHGLLLLGYLAWRPGASSWGPPGGAVGECPPGASITPLVRPVRTEHPLPSARRASRRTRGVSRRPRRAWTLRNDSRFREKPLPPRGALRVQPTTVQDFGLEGWHMGGGGGLGPLPPQEAQGCWPICSQRSAHLRPPSQPGQTARPCCKPGSRLPPGAPGTQPQRPTDGGPSPAGALGWEPRPPKSRTPPRTAPACCPS